MVLFLPVLELSVLYPVELIWETYSRSRDCTHFAATRCHFGSVSLLHQEEYIVQFGSSAPP